MKIYGEAEPEFNGASAKFEVCLDVTKEQVERTAQFLQDKIMDKAIFYVSPYLRTRPTAQAIYAKVPKTALFLESPLARECCMLELKHECKACRCFLFSHSLRRIAGGCGFESNAVLQCGHSTFGSSKSTNG